MFVCSGVNLLVGTENGLMLLDRSGQGKVYNLITRRRFLQMDVLEGLNVLVTISGRSNTLTLYAHTQVHADIHTSHSFLVYLNADYGSYHTVVYLLCFFYTLIVWFYSLKFK